jgi:4-hydroxythreonine-4-phosphate dehydrogenase
VLPLALTLGEPAGIGPDLALAVWHRRAALNVPPFYLVGDEAFLQRRAARLGLTVPTLAVTPNTACAAFALALPVVPIAASVTAEPGHPDASSAPAAIESIRRAVNDVLAVAEPGHTEFLATLVQEATGKTLHPVMMLWSPELAVVPVTIHLPLRQIFQHLSIDLVVETGRIVARDLVDRFHIAHPRLVVAGLNPHAGENGALGEEDLSIVAPAVARLVADGIDAKGPLPADTLFHGDARARYDAALCMYHDQALIPIKTLAFDHAVNVTLGLPFVRTSPDHGTAFDIAGKGVADPTSLVAALQLAARLASAGARTAAT